MRSHNYQKRSREIIDNVCRYCSPKKFEGSSSRFIIRDKTSRMKLDPRSSHGCLQGYEGNQNINGDEEDGLVESEVVSEVEGGH
ncbi:hypothetical protein LguiA_004088 [Lonicera macranthoides]